LYERIRDEARHLNSVGLFFECLPDDPQLCRDPDTLKQNAARLRFYERYGARPIMNTAYETPLSPGGDNPPYLVYDNLGRSESVPRGKARQIARAILERKYHDMCPPEYVDMVVNSFRDDVIALRPSRYKRTDASASIRKVYKIDQHIVLVVNDRHEIHHVKERGYVEAPVRVKTILDALESLDIFAPAKIRHFAESHITAVHARGFVNYLKRVCANVEPGKSVYPYVFPIRNAARPPKELWMRAGYYCIDTFTPLNENAYAAAKRAVDCALTAADALLDGGRLAYALVRPPGHHAERNVFGGFCYFNSAAIAANYLSRHGTVAMLDIDYHHGNGAQDIFYHRADVLTISIHGHPRFAYPYFTGFKEESGAGAGEGYNLNMPLQEQVDGTRYHDALRKAVRRIVVFQAQFLVVPLGLDPAKHDPTGSWSLTTRDFLTNGRLIGELRLPTLVVQEGGYRIRSLGQNARAFFQGLWEGAHC
jgi:acetoin utilization deacetylase AcuC-like enzyme